MFSVDYFRPHWNTSPGNIHIKYVGRDGYKTRAFSEFSSAESKTSCALPFSLQVDDTDALPFYPYRDDALLTWKALWKYVEDIVALYYGKKYIVSCITQNALDIVPRFSCNLIETHPI
jgi:hypothetical protein